MEYSATIWGENAMRIRRAALPFLVFSCATVCACHTTTQPKPTAIGTLTPANEQTKAPATLILLADAQINENHGAPTFWESKFAQIKLKQAVARRSVQQTVFSDVLLAETIKRARAADNAPVIFLGDAMNMSCDSEYTRFINAMKSAGKEWIALPGNHDGFYTGVTQPTIEEVHRGDITFVLNPGYGRDRDVWDWVCRGGELPKSVAPSATSQTTILASGFVERYAENVLSRFPGSLESAAPQKPGCHERTWTAGLIRDITWCSTNGIRGSRPPWQAFVAQRVAAGTSQSPIDIILLDSSVYHKEPCVFWCSDVGIVGGLGAEQRDLVQPWLDEDQSLGRRVIVMAHHPISDWQDDRADQSWLEQNVGKNKVSLAVSAHTHNGCVRDPFAGALTQFRELNVGSIIDYPISYTRLWLNADATSLNAQYETVPITPAFLGVQSSCEDDNDDDSIYSQTSGRTSGPYTNQLSQIRAELRQAQRVLANSPHSSSTAIQSMQQRLAHHLILVKAAEITSLNRCSSVFAWRALDCERTKKVESIDEDKTIREVARGAQDELGVVETSTEWKSFLASPQGGALGACIAAFSVAPYWAAIENTSNAERAPLRECLKEN
jgi:hypothetical protein